MASRCVYNALVYLYSFSFKLKWFGGMLTVLEIYAHLYISFIVIVRTNYANVSVLTDFNFTDKIKNYEVALIKFYVPW